MILGEIETAQTFLIRVSELTPQKSTVTAAPARAQTLPQSGGKRQR